MRDINTVVPKVARALAQGDEPEKVSLKAVNDVFKAMHGSYGKQFLEKFATGIQDAGGHDEGIKSARMAWAHALKRFDIEVVGLALDRMRTVHPVWAPALGEFEALCVIAEGELRAKERVDEAMKALPCSGEAFSAATKEAREAFKRRYAESRRRPVREVGPDGMGDLCKAIADAVATAGGDEVAELRRLDAMFTKKEEAHANDHAHR